MKLTTALFANLICLPLVAQRDYRLVEDRNPWLTSGNAAALVTLADSTIAHGTVYYQHDGGSLRTTSQGKRQNTYGADVRSYCRLSEDAVVYGSMTYANSTGTQMAGSMFHPTTELMPFDIVEYGDGTAGSKQGETFSIAGAIGWDATRDIAIGARVDFMAGDYAKHRDLRHSNTMMDLSARATILYRPWGIGAGVTYRRSTETVTFKTYGTTDQVYKTLIDYANGIGEVETFGGDGFTDSSREMPLFSEYVGATAQWGWRRLLIDAAWQHRTGYYGKQSQYTVSRSQHRGDLFSAHIRYDMAKAAGQLWWIDMALATEDLTTHRSNYRRRTAQDNASLTYYEYYEPTKMSDKTQTEAAIAVSGYWKPAGEIYLWHLNGGMDLWHGRQTAYMYPEMVTAKRHTLSPFITLRRGMLFHDTSLLTAQAGYAMTFGSAEQLAAHAKVSYEIPLRSTAIRPALSIRYDYRTATGGDMKGTARHTIMVAAEATF